MPLYYLSQYFTTTLSVVGGINSTQTTGITLAGVSGITDITKPGIVCLSYSDPLNTTVAEYISFSSINGSNVLQGVTRGIEGFSAKSHANGVSVAFVLSRSHINEINKMLEGTTSGATLLTPTIDDALLLNHETSVSTPASGKLAIYTKSDNRL
jgi:hypothetical protein